MSSWYNNNEIYFSVDIEAGGPIPLRHKLMSIGAVVYNSELEQLGTFYETIDDETGLMFNDTVTEFWEKQPEAWNEVNTGTIPVGDAIGKFDLFCRRFDGKRRFVAKPTWFDYSWIRAYMLHYTGSDPFEMRVCDYAQHAYALNIKLKNVKNEFPHHALWDAMKQGEQFVDFMKRARKKRQDLYHSHTTIHNQRLELMELRGKFRAARKGK